MSFANSSKFLGYYSPLSANTSLPRSKPKSLYGHGTGTLGSPLTQSITVTQSREQPHMRVTTCRRCSHSQSSHLDWDRGFFPRGIHKQLGALRVMTSWQTPS